MVQSYGAAILDQDRGMCLLCFILSSVVCHAGCLFGRHGCFFWCWSPWVVSSFIFRVGNPLISRAVSESVVDTVS